MIDTAQQETIKRVEYIKNNLPFWAAKFVKIRLKQGGAPAPLVFKFAQMKLHEFIEGIRAEGKPVRVCVPKARQLGVSTYTTARYLHRASMNRGVPVFILSHMSDSTNYLFDMVKRMYNSLPDPIRPAVGRSNRKELKFASLDSEYALGTAGSEEVGRGTSPLLLHMSEAAFYQKTDELVTGLMQGVPKSPNSEIIIESTANGINNMFYNLCMKGIDQSSMSRYRTFFLPWHWDPEYQEVPQNGFKANDEEKDMMDLYGLTLPQVFWRRRMLDDEFNGDIWKFKQEYPCVSEGSLVSTDRGYVPIEDVIVGDNTPQGEVTKVMPKGPKKCFRVETYMGYTIDVTEDHLFLLEDGSFRPARELCGCRVVLSPMLFPEKNHWFSFPKKPYGQWTGEITPAFGLFLGFFMGDGCLSYNTLSIAFSEKDYDTIFLMKQYVEGAFGVKVALRKAGVRGVELRVADRELACLLTGLGCAENNRRKIGVPECILRSPKSVVREFLRGLFETDGHVSKNCDRVLFFSKHLYFVREVQRLLLGFGITSRVNQVVKKTSSGISYPGCELVLRAHEARKFVVDVGFVSERKCRTAKERPKGKYTTRLNISLIDTVQTVTEIGVRRVYDLSVPGTNTFNANGFVVHNCYLSEAFVASGDRLIKPEWVEQARKHEIKTPDENAPRILGVDGAGESGADRTVLVLRQGKKILWYRVYREMNPMRLAGIIAKDIDEWYIDMVFADKAYGDGAVSRLHELGYRNCVQGVHFGEEALDPELYLNKRAQMYGYLKEWFEEGGADIPNEEEFVSDILSIPGFVRSGSRGRYKLPPKEELRADNGGKSPDISDAASLTFAYPVRAKRRQSMLRGMDIDSARAISPFKSRRGATVNLRQNGGDRPSEFFLDKRVGA